MTYDDFEKYGVRRMSVKFGIMVASALGWIDTTEEGHAGAADTRRAARYAVTWVDRHDGAPRSNRWKMFETLADAKRVVEDIRAKLKAEGSRRARRDATTALKAVA